MLSIIEIKFLRRKCICFVLQSSRLLWEYLRLPVTRCTAFPTYCNRSGSSERMQTTKNVSSKRTNYQPTRSRIARLQGPDTTRQRRRWKRGRDWLARGVIWHARLHRPIRADLSQRLITPAPFVTFLFPARFAQLFVSGGRPLPPGQIPDTPSDDPRPRRVAQIASLMAITSCCSAIYCSSDHAPVDGGGLILRKLCGAREVDHRGNSPTPFSFAELFVSSYRQL